MDIDGSIHNSNTNGSSTVTSIGIWTFMQSIATIYTEVATRPNGWDSAWMPNNPVIWGCTLSEDKAYVVSFTKSSVSIDNPTGYNGISASYRQGYTFKEWNTSTDGAGTAYAAADINGISDGTKLYAIWI